MRWRPWRSRRIDVSRFLPVTGPEMQGPPRKEDAWCCVARRDELGRLPVGFCGPKCIRRAGAKGD